MCRHRTGCLENADGRLAREGIGRRQWKTTKTVRGASVELRMGGQWQATIEVGDERSKMDSPRRRLALSENYHSAFPEDQKSYMLTFARDTVGLFSPDASPLVP